MGRRARLRFALSASLFIAGVVLPGAARAVTSSNPLDSWRTVRIGLPVLDASFIRPRNTLIATVDFDHPVFGNDLVELNPETGAVVRAVLVGSRPSALAVSDDFTTAYVGLSGAPDVVVVDLLTFTVKQRFPIRPDIPGWVAPPEDVAVVPGHADTVAVASADGEVTIFHDGEALPKKADAFTSQIIFSDGLLYGGNYKSSARDFVAMTVDDDGVSIVDWHEFGIGSFGDMKPAGPGRIATTAGQLVDPSGPTVVRDFHQFGAFEPTVGNDRIAYIGDANGGPLGATVSLFNMSTGARIGSRNFSELADAHEMVATRHSYAVVTWHGLYLLGPLVPATSPVIPSTVPTFVDSLTPLNVPVEVGEMRYDPRRRLLYATVANSSPTHADELVAVNPVTGAIEKSLSFGADIWALAVSGDESTAYVGLNSSYAVAVVDLDSFTERSRFVLEGIPRGPDPSPYGPAISAFDIAVQPGTNDVVAVSMIDSEYDSARGVGIYVDGTRTGADWTYPVNAGALAFADASTLYATDFVESPGELYRYTVDADGGLTYDETMEWIDLRDLEITPDGRGWGPFGGVVDLATGRAQGILWRVTGGVEPVLAQNRVYGVSDDGISEYDATTYRRIGFKRFFLGYAHDNPVVRTTIGLATLSGAGLVLLNPPLCQGLVPTVVGAGTTVGTPENDIIVGSSGSDTIDGLAGDDIICGLSGGDRILGGDGNDRIAGGAGTQLLRGGPGSDVLYGLDGADLIDGGDGDDRLYGGAGTDLLVGAAGTDRCFGRVGDDKQRECEADG